MESMTSEEYRKMIEAEDAANGRRSPQRSAAGRKAQAVGLSFQKQLNAYHEQLVKARLLASIVEVAPPMRAIKQPSRGAPHYILLPGGGPCDYSFVAANGVGGSFDAKSTEHGNSFSWPDTRRHQLEILERIDRVSGRRSPAFALVQWRAHDEVRLHPVWTIYPGHIVYRAQGVVVRQQAAGDGCNLVGPAWPLTLQEIWS